MGDVKGFFDSFKEFIWDIVGYFLPGSYILILLSLCVNEKYYVSSYIYQDNNEFFTFIFIVISYLLGYLAYGFSLLKEKIRGKYSYTKKIESKVACRNAFILSKKLITDLLKEKGVGDDLNIVTVRDLRSIVMSFSPEQDQKIYTFTFRSDLSNHIANISSVIGVLGIIFSIFFSPELSIFKITSPYMFLYVFLLVCYLFLRETRNRFYEISIGLPFSIYTAKAIK